jgi:hypothetical protein
LAVAQEGMPDGTLDGLVNGRAVGKELIDPVSADLTHIPALSG